MASVQCQKTCETSCQHQHSSLGQKVSDLFKGNSHHHVQSQSCYSQTSGNAHAANGCATKCQGKTKKVHRRSLFDKIKDGLSSLGSDSSSESDSDNEKRNKSKN